MNHQLRLFALISIFAVRCLAQGLGNPNQGLAAGGQGVANGNVATGNGGANGNKKDPDQDWANVVTLVTPAAPHATPPGQQKTPVQLAADQAQKVTVAIQAAQAAKDFYTTNPTHVNAPAAKKLEAVQGLLGVTDTDKSQEAAAQHVAANFCSDQSNSLSDRFEVALLSESVNARANLKGAQATAELQKIGDTLRKEFGDQPEVFNFYASVARGADLVTARAIASSLLQWPANPEAKEEAQSILTRDALLGKPLTLKLTTIDGQTIDLAQATGKTTILYFSSLADANTNPFSNLNASRKKVPATAQLVYIVGNATADQLQAIKKLATVSGAFCTDPNSTISGQLQVRETPYIFVVNASGLLAGFGPLAEVGNVLAAIGK